ncbi:MAG: iron-containing alcohol dehydrogenase [Coriobacteriales bacterium]|jgi:alcohol dehydrogenase|nr:iron-containing alcohol dehydrogenase [Coriobacteriales bacterium]
MYQLVQEVKLVFGSGCIKNLGTLLLENGLSRAFIVCDPGTVAAGLVARVVASLQSVGLASYVYDQVMPEPSHMIAEKGIEALNEQGCDVVIGVGGGSSLDCAKAINILRFNEGPLLRFAGEGTGAPMRRSPHLYLVPTTSGTGSELSDGIVMSDDEGIKQGILAVNAKAEYAFLDPELLVTMPRGLTLATGLDVFSHACEGYMTTCSNPVSDAIVEKVMQMVVEWLPVAVEDGTNIEARSQMAIASTLAGWMLGYAHTNAGHSVAHVLSSLYHIPHGTACAYATPWILEFNAPAVPQKVRWVGTLLGASFTGEEGPEEIGRLVREAYLRFRDDTLQMQPASHYAVDRTLFAQVAQKISEEMFQAFQPRPMSADDAQEILEKIFAEL